MNTICTQTHRCQIVNVSSLSWLSRHAEYVSPFMSSSDFLVFWQASCWRDSLLFLKSTSNDYVRMFSLTTLEKTVRKRWVGMDAGDKAQVRAQLQEFLIKRHAVVPAYIRTKVAKLLVDVAATDWPHFYPTFFTDIFGWIRLVLNTDVSIFALFS